MNPWQRIVILAGMLAYVGMGHYSPWSTSISAQGLRVSIFAGYKFIAEKQEKKSLYETVDTRRLLIQWTMVVAATVGLTLVFSSRRHEAQRVRLARPPSQPALPVK